MELSRIDTFELVMKVVARRLDLGEEVLDSFCPVEAPISMKKRIICAILNTPIPLLKVYGGRQNHQFAF
jgi:hypothetical protein